MLDLADALRGEAKGSVDWLGLIREANDHLVGPALHEIVSQNTTIPDDVREYLHLIHHLNRARNTCLESQALEAIASLNAGGITPVLLKGAALLLTTPEHLKGRRLLSDLDLMLREADLVRGVEVLVRLGYRPVAGENGPHAFAKLARSKDAATIDLHHRPPGPSQLYRQPPLAAETSLTIGGAYMKIPSSADQAMQLIAHDMFNDGGLRDGTIQIRHLLDIAELSRRDRGMDWTSIRRRFEEHGMRIAFDVYALNLRHLLELAVDHRQAPSLLARLLFQRQLLKAKSRLFKRLDNHAIRLAQRIRQSLRR
jgi:hypothetical protein